MESIEKIERVTDEQFVEVLKSRSEGAADDGVIFEAWQDQLADELGDIYRSQGSEALSAEVINRFTDRAILYYRGGFKTEAIAEMEELADAAGSEAFEGSALLKRTKSVLRKMRAGQEL